MELKDRLKQARKNAGLTQAELADRVGIKQASVSEIERGLTRTSGYLV
ncbi:MAG: helix-turn-helix transcriptional regulator, partial [Pseudomonas sp.]|nr:helix-turn-helix transcriptional regulator [Pseudomonas sp.]